jgi:uncharacterized membrane protein required for colicin V production
MFWVAYFLSPRFCHKFVGYLEEEAVKTYTHCIEVYLKDITNTLAICGGVVYRILVHLVNGVCRPILKQYVTVYVHVHFVFPGSCTTRNSILW